MFIQTARFRWDRRLVNLPSTIQGGLGSTENRVFLQQLWGEYGTPRPATQEDVDAGNAAFVGSSVMMVSEWRDVPGLEGGLKP